MRGNQLEIDHNICPRITVVVAVYNGAKTLQSCLDSIESQSYKNRELIIMDGGSTDGTVDILKKYSSKINYWESSPDRGIYHAWNKALAHATGDWIYFLGADDLFHDCYVVEKFISLMCRVKNPPLIAYAQIEYCKGEDRTVLGKPWEEISRTMLSIMCIHHQGTFHHKELFSRCGGFDEQYRIAGDYQLLLKSLRYAEPLFLNNFLVADQYAGGMSSNRATRWKVLREFRMAQKELAYPIRVKWVWEYVKAQLWRVLLCLKR